MNRPNYTSTSDQREATKAQFAKFARALAKAEPRDLPRTYGFEIETPEADTVRDNAFSAIRALNHAEEVAETGKIHRLEDYLDFKGDGSVSGGPERDFCECECYDCTEHFCDCEHCDTRGREPNHECGERECYGEGGTYQEITSIGGTLTTHPVSLELLAEADLMSAEINESCGLHVHVSSADLNGAEVARVITAYRVVADLMGYIAGRRDESYCRDNNEEESDYARNGFGTDKYRAVNTAPHFSQYRTAKTIEFRQHEGTNSPTEVRAWAVLMVALVEYAKRSTGVYWLARCKDFDELAKELNLTA